MDEKPTYISFSAEINQNTVEGFMGIITSEFNSGVRELYILISSPGGNVSAGVTLYNFLKSLPIKITMHNIGIIDSIGNLVFLAGSKRFSVPSSSFLFHGVGLDLPQATRLEEKGIKEMSTSIDRDQKLISKIVISETKISIEELDKMFLNAVTKTPDQAKELGIIEEVKEAEVPENAKLIQFVFQQRPWK